MNRKLLLLSIPTVFLLMAGVTLATHSVEYSTPRLEGGFQGASYCDQSKKDSVTVGDEPHRLLYSVSVYGAIVHDDDFAVSWRSQANAGQTIQRLGGCGCGASDGCGNVGSTPYYMREYTVFQDFGANWFESITISAEALEKKRPHSGYSDVGFSGPDVLAIWRSCHPGQITDTGACRQITGEISVSKTSCMAPCNATVTWSSQYATNVKVYRRVNGGAWNVVWTGSSGDSVPENNLEPGTYEYSLNGNDGFGTESVLAPRPTITVSTAPPLDCFGPSSANTNQSISFSASGGSSGEYSWSAPDGTPSSQNGLNFSTSYSSPGTKIVTVTRGGLSGQCIVVVNEPTPISVTLSADPVNMTLPDNSTRLTWTTTGSPTSCTGSWDGTKSVSVNGGSENKTGLAAGTHTYTITCSKAGVSNALASVTVIVNTPMAENICSLSITPTNLTVGGTAYLEVNSTPSGYSFDWGGTDNGGPDIYPTSGGVTPFSTNYTFTSPATYTRYAVINFPGGRTCATETKSITISGISVTLSADPVNMTLPDNSTRLTWTTTGSPTSCLASGSWSGNKTASGDSETRTGLAAGTHTYTITCSKAGVSNALASVTVRVDDGVREVSDANQVTAATNGRYLAHYDEDDEYLYTSLEGNWVDPLNGTVPLNNVDIKFQFRGSAMLFADEVRFDCTNNGSIERTISVNSERRSEAIAFDLCNYSSPGTYTARATGWKRNGGVMRIATCYDRPCDDTATIISVTTPLPPDFSLNKNRDIFANIIGRDAVTSNESTLTIAAFDGFASTINLSVDSISPALPGAVFNFSDASLTSGEYARGSQFSVTVPSSTPSGIYTITIRGIDGGLVRTLNVKLNVNARDPSFREI